jgi:hypothetical protein
MGEPALRWRDPDGSETAGLSARAGRRSTFMAQFGPDGRLQRIVNVLDSAQFARLVPGRDDRPRVRLFGPPVPQWTVYFEARDELVWEWAICDEWNRRARFDVLFRRPDRRRPQQLPAARPARPRRHRAVVQPLAGLAGRASGAYNRAE